MDWFVTFVKHYLIQGTKIVLRMKLIMSIKGHFRSNNFLRIILGYLHFITVKLSCIEYGFVSEIIENTFMKELF